MENSKPATTSAKIFKRVPTDAEKRFYTEMLRELKSDDEMVEKFATRIPGDDGPFTVSTLAGAGLGFVAGGPIGSLVGAAAGMMAEVATYYHWNVLTALEGLPEELKWVVVSAVSKLIGGTDFTLFLTFIRTEKNVTKLVKCLNDVHRDLRRRGLC